VGGTNVARSGVSSLGRGVVELNVKCNKNKMGTKTWAWSGVV
jgi:hypothetical protein